MFQSPSQKCFCAFCKHERRYYSRKHIGWTNVALSFLASVLLMFGFWQSFDPRVLVIFVASLMFSEAFVQIRWKLSMTCPYCGFDPVMYVKDPEKVCKKVKQVIDQRNEGALILSKKDPSALIHKKILPPGDKLKDSAKVSRRV